MSDTVHVVTGGAGFIGSHLVRTLVDRGECVRLIDDFSSGCRENLAEIDATAYEVFEVDIRDAKALEPAFRDATYVYHQAAVPSVPRSVDDPVTSITANVEGSLNVLLAARDAGAAKVVYASSSSVYGDTEELPKHEGLRPSPLSPYAVSKASAEMLGLIFPKLYGLETVGLRYFNVFGPRQDPNSQYAAVIPRFITRLLDGKPPIIYGDGEQTRDFTFVENVVEANLGAARSSASGISVNIACGDRISLNQLASRLNEILGTKLTPEYQDTRAGDVRDSQADIRRAREAFGFDPAVSFDEGLCRTAAWYQKQSAS